MTTITSAIQRLAWLAVLGLAISLPFELVQPWVNIGPLVFTNLELAAALTMLVWACRCALLRRVPSPNRPVVAAGGEISIDKQKREVLVRAEPVDLTPTEYDLLLLLAEHAGAVLDHETLLRGVWGQEYTKDNDYLKVYIWHLRRKIEPDPKNPTYLHNELSIGYRFDPQ